MIRNLDIRIIFDDDLVLKVDELNYEVTRELFHCVYEGELDIESSIQLFDFIAKKTPFHFKFIVKDAVNKKVYESTIKNATFIHDEHSSEKNKEGFERIRFIAYPDIERNKACLK